MTSLRTLAALAVVVVFISAVYAFSVDGRERSVRLDLDDGRTVRHTISGDRGEFVLRDDDRVIKAEWRGEFELDALGADIAAVEDEFEIEIEEGGVDERVKFENDDGDIERTYYRDGERQPDGDETDQAVADALLRFLRASALKADERVAAILEADGAVGALDEIDALQGNHAIRRYTTALVEQADLSPEEIERLAGQLRSIDSDHDLSRALSDVLEHETLTPETTRTLIRVAEAVRGDHDLRQLVEAFAERPLDDESLELAIGLYERIDGDHDLRVAAQAFFEGGELNAAQAARLLAAAERRIESDHDMRLVLAETAQFFARDDETSAAWLGAYATLESSYDQRLAIEEVAERGDFTGDRWLALIDAVETVESSHDRRLALEAIAERMGDDAALLDAYREAAMSIDSKHDRERALEAIGD